MRQGIYIGAMHSDRAIEFQGLSWQPLVDAKISRAVALEAEVEIKQAT